MSSWTKFELEAELCFSKIFTKIRTESIYFHSHFKELERLGPLIDDPIMREKPAEVKHIIFCCGKHYYALVKERETRGIKNVAIVRVESLSPFPAPHLQAILSSYKNAQSKFMRKCLSPTCSTSREALINILIIEFTWSQEEHRNAGPWTFLSPRFANLVGCKVSLHIYKWYIGKFWKERKTGTTGTGSGNRYRKEFSKEIMFRFSLWLWRNASMLLMLPLCVKTTRSFDSLYFLSTL